MNSFQLALMALTIAMLAQAMATGQAIVQFLRKKQPRATTFSWLALAIGSLLLALHQANSLELALKTGLYDLHQAVLIALAAIIFALGVYGLRRQSA